MVLNPRVALMCFTALAFPPDLDGNSFGSKPLSEPSSLNVMVFAWILSTGIPNPAPTGCTICRKPPDTRKTSLPLARNASTSSLIPFEYLGGCFDTKAAKLSVVTAIASNLSCKASAKSIPPSIALFVIASTRSPAPKNAPSSSMPSSTHTVESTSNATASASCHIFKTSALGCFPRDASIVARDVARLAFDPPRGILGVVVVTRTHARSTPHISASRQSVLSTRGVRVPLLIVPPRFPTFQRVRGVSLFRSPLACQSYSGAP
mmetsp:Transcript_4089/g.14920  ORF Transcript_4089/g.14920 Transcript_4089/m.14920 type:complete len:263 (-) Transcript_4089:118-906(-)